MSLDLAASLLALALAPPAAPSPVEAAEKRAAAAVALLPAHPAEALVEARKALALTADFEPTAFVTAGRKGEVVEDAYLAARESYRAHRAKLYEAVGLALAASGDGAAALRYLRRAALLDPRPERTTGLGRTLLAQRRGREAMLVLEGAIGPEPISPETASLLEGVADLVGLPSAQAEIDRVRLRAVPGAEFRDGPLTLPEGLRLSTSPVFRLDDAPQNILYAAEGSCRSCSSDLAELKRLVPASTRILLVPESLDQDRALRQVVDLYRYAWPLLLGKGLKEALAVEPRSLLITARGGWVVVVLKAPWAGIAPCGPRPPRPHRRSGDVAARAVEPRQAGAILVVGGARPPGRRPGPRRGRARAAGLRRRRGSLPGESLRRGASALRFRRGEGRRLPAAPRGSA